MNFDHAVINVLGNMEGVLPAYRRLGFYLTPRGYHTLGSINHLAVFGHTYMELLGYAPGERGKRAELWEHPAGLTGLAFRSEDAAGLHEAITRRGVPVEPWKDFSRPVVIDGRQQDAAFRTFQLDRGQLANGRIFFCQHKTPELLWRPADMDHPNGVTEIAEVVVACDRPADIQALVGAADGLEKLADDSIGAGTTRVRFLSRDKVAAEFGAIPDDERGSMRMAALGLACRSLPDLAALLSRNAVPFTATGNAVLVDPQTACGVWLRFTAP